jgi:hypothetical protein
VNSNDSSSIESIERRIRLLTILRSAQTVGFTPVGISTVHTLAYLADALAPVWHLPIMDAQVLKRRTRPFFPVLQHDLDRLVGQGLVLVQRLAYTPSDEGDGWRLDADYILSDLALPVFELMKSFDLQRSKLEFVQEVVYAASGLGQLGIDRLGLIDATYSDPVVDVGGVIDMEVDEGGSNATADVARRFAEITRTSGDLSQAGSVHLYVRHLYKRMQIA